jgi:hypothetical protein
MYAENQEIFSYTPCKPFNEETKTGFPRVIFPYENLGGFQFSTNPTGIKIISSNAEQTKEIWQFITQEVLKQGYCLATKITEPK